MAPFERLRSLVRWSGDDHLELAVEAAECLADFGDDPAGLLMACRRLLAHHSELAPLWWSCSRILTAPDPREAAMEAAKLLADDPTPRRLADRLPFPHDEPVAVIGWPPAVAAAAVARPDLDLIAVAPTDGAGSLHRRLRHVEQPLEILSPEGAARRRPTHVLVEPAGVGPAGRPAAAPVVLLDGGDGEALRMLTGVGAAVWVVVAAGHVMPGPLLDALATANRGRLARWPDVEAALAVGPAGAAPWGDRSLAPDCPVAPELLRPL